MQRRKAPLRATPGTTPKSVVWRRVVLLMLLLGIAAVVWQGRDEGRPATPTAVAKEQPQPPPQPADLRAADTTATASGPMSTTELRDLHTGDGSGVRGDVDAAPSPDSRNVQPVERKETVEQTTQLILDADDSGSYYVKGSINGEGVLFLLDTGATWISIPERLRWRLDLQRGRYVKVATAGGVVGNYETRVESLDVGPFHFQDVAAALNPYAPNDVVLLGMSALKDVQFTQTGGQLILSRQHADEATVVATPRSPETPELVIRRSVRDCMGPSNVLNSEALKCIEGR